MSNSTKIQIIFHSLYGHTYQLAEAIAEGAREVEGTEASLYRVKETLSDEVLEKMGAREAMKAFAHLPEATAAQLADADAILLGCGTRYGSAPAQLQALLDQTGGHWSKGALVGKVGGMFTSTGTQHGGQETTLMNLSTFFFHQGMVIAGVPYTAKGLMSVDGISGGSPYGSSTVAGTDGQRTPTQNELEVARFQGRHVAELARKLK